MIREEVLKTNPEFKDFLVPACVYQHECKEFMPCGVKLDYKTEKEKEEEYDYEYENYGRRIQENDTCREN
jgi:hypothetical protein